LEFRISGVKTEQGVPSLPVRPMPQDGEMQTLPLKEGQWNIKKEFINISMADPVWIRHLLLIRLQ
jgi:hypothetical protein